MGRVSAVSALYDARLEFMLGVKAMLPMLLGAVPFGVAYGALGLASGLGALSVLGMSSVVFAGSAQIVAVQLFNAAAPVAVMLVTILMVNLRHVLYSASLNPKLKRLSSRWKWILSYFLTDEAYAVTIIHYDKNSASLNNHWFFLGAGVTMWSAWQASTAIGVFVGTVIPKNLPLDFAITLTFIALLIPMLKDRTNVVVSVTAGIVAFSTLNLPFRLNLIIAVIFAVGVGLSVDWFERNRR